MARRVFHGVGKKAIEILREELAARGLSFADEDPPDSATDSAR